MPEIKLQHVISVSSEDKNFPAENLLKTDGFKKWKSSEPGEKHISVTLQLEKASQIHQIDIGNDGSAFVEVLVKKSSSKNEDFQVLLVASAFLSPSEAKNGQNLTKVRIFGPDKLSKAVSGEKWDVVKIVCTQPFNKGICYGLSFVRFHSEPDESSKPSPKKQLTLGKFTIKAEESDEDDIKTGSLFASRKKEEAASLTGAAAVRAASRLAAEEEKEFAPVKPSVSSTSPKEKEKTPGKRKASDEDDASSHSSSSKTSEAPSSKTPMRKQSTSLSSVSSVASSRKDGPPPLKKTKTEPGKPSKEKEFSRLMADVVFVLSGYQNPERSKIRDRALEMGAEYKPDWVKGCTHLICAFPNTPKYNSVKGKGRIVSKDWISDSYKKKKLMSWRNYRVGKAPSPPGSSEDESDDGLSPQKKSPPSKKQAKADAPKLDSKQAESSKTKPKKTPSKSKPKTEDDDIYGGSTDEGSGDDTDDEIERLKRSLEKDSGKGSNKKNSNSPSRSKTGDIEEEEDPYGGSTDEDDGDDEDAADVDEDGFPPLPSFLSDLCFMLFGDFDFKERRTLNRYVVAYNGIMADYMGEKVTHVLTKQDWDENFDQALSNYKKLIFVRPEWIYACDSEQKLLPYQKYVVVPK